MIPRKDTPDLWSFWLDLPNDFCCNLPAETKYDKDEFARIWILTLWRGDEGYDSAEVEKQVWKLVGL